MKPCSISAIRNIILSIWYQQHWWPSLCDDVSLIKPGNIIVIDAGKWLIHYNDIIMSTMPSQITSLTIVYSAVYSRCRSKKTSKLRVTAFVRGIYQWPANSLHKWAATRERFSFDEVIMKWAVCVECQDCETELQYGQYRAQNMWLALYDMSQGNHALITKMWDLYCGHIAISLMFCLFKRYLG